MKKTFASLACAIGFAATSHASVTISIDAGVLRNATGTSTVPVGGLLQLIASPAGANGTFGAPTATSYVSGDNILLGSFAMNYDIFTGATDSSVNFVLQNTTATASSVLLDAGDALLLRWYPTLTFANAPSGPGIGTTYGQFRSAVGENGGSAWIVPADNTILTPPTGLNFFTTDLTAANSGITGTHAPIMGFATNVVAVPEPSSVMLLGGAAVGLLGWAKLRRRSA